MARTQRDLNESRLKKRIEAMIDEKIRQRVGTRNILEDRNGKFGYGAFQQNSLISNTPCFRMGQPGPYPNQHAC
tara:strand:- start:457 stop:678 length:222 start_codon:yes stop_codon:yes gene_type:complete